MSGNIKGIIVEIGGDTSGLQKALKKVNSSTSSLSKELKGINSLLKLDPKNTELVSQKQIVLKKNIEETENKIRALKEAQDRYIESGGDLNSSEYRNLQREIINTENKLKQMKLEASKWTQAGRSIEEFGNKITNISNKIDKVGTTLTTRLTLPILGIATAAVNSAREFESAFTGVEKTVDGTATQMANLKQGIKDMSEEIPASTTEIAGVAEAAGQLGIQTDNVLAFTKTMINMGNATNLSADEAATTLARFANVTKMSQSDFDRLGSVIVALGNNFATTEAEISAMGMNLASAGTQVGMSQSQIMALATALSSVGLEAQAGGTAFSKVMVNMQLAVEKGGKELKNFASVAGMSTQQFKKAFKEDATNAIMQFVDGLSKSGERGKSAIKILDDMGITETRLRDALLRSANASEVMGKAIELGNQAWEENAALTNEANKRYQTLDSRMEMTKNKIKNVATNTGDKLTPSFNKLLDKVDGLIDKFDGLNEEETENVIKTAAIVAAIGPAIKILGTFGKGIGNTIKGVGTLSQAIGVMRTGTVSANKSANLLAGELKAIVSPAGLTTIAITTIAGTLAYLAYKQKEATKETQELANSMSNSLKEYEDYNREIDETASANLSHIESVRRLKDELNQLVDENGKVKEGYKSRVDFILSELNKALGTEYELNGDVIQSYQELQNEIDTTVEKKKAEMTLQAEEQKYQKAIEEEKTAVSELKEVYDKMGMSIEEAKAKKSELENQMRELEKKGKLYGEYLDIGKEKKNLENLISAYEDADSKVEQCVKNKKGYENDYALFVEGKYNEMGKTIFVTTENWNDKTLEELKTSIQEQGKELDIYSDIYKRKGDEVALQNAQQAQKNLENLASELAKRTSTVKDLGEDEIEAWKEIASQSYEAYSIEIANMSPDMQTKIQEATGIIAAGTPQMQAKAGELGQKTVDEFDKNADAKQKALNTITGYLNGLDDNTKRELLRQAGIEDVDLVLDQLNRGDLSEENGRNILKGLWNGLKDGNWQGKILGAASGLAQAVNKAFTGKDGWDENSPSKKMKKFTEYYIQPISDVMKNNKSSIIKNAQELAARVNEVFEEQTINMPQIKDFGKLQGNLSNQIIDSTKTFFTTPQIVFNVQELDEAKLQQCFNYVNKKFGSAY